MNDCLGFQNSYLDVSTVNLADILINKNMGFKKLLTRRDKNGDFSHQSAESSATTTRQAGSTDNIIVSSSTQQQEQIISSTSNRIDKYGLLPMNSQNSRITNTVFDENYLLDIIAVHGITGDAYDTWTHKNGNLWLRDFIPEDFPGARVFSFGYNANVFCSRSKGNVESFARSLLGGLINERLEKKVTSPPLFTALKLFFVMFRVFNNA